MRRGLFAALLCMAPASWCSAAEQHNIHGAAFIRSGRFGIGSPGSGYPEASCAHGGEHRAFSARCVPSTGPVTR